MLARHAAAKCVLTRRFSSTGSKNVAVVLAGCGVYDGAEVQESVFILSALSKAGATVQCFAPDIKQHHVIDHTAGKEMAEERNVLKESARICRGQVKPLTNLKAADYDALIFSGGFGAAKNLSDFAFKGAEVTVEAQTARVIQEFYDAKKALGFSCIAPVLAAKVLGCHGIELTVGSDVESKSWPNAGAAGAVTALGAKHVVTEHKAHADSKNKVVSSSAYMCDTAPVHVIQESVESMVNETIKLA